MVRKLIESPCSFRKFLSIELLVVLDHRREEFVNELRKSHALTKTVHNFFELTAMPLDLFLPLSLRSISLNKSTRHIVKHFVKKFRM